MDSLKNRYSLNRMVKYFHRLANYVFLLIKLSACSLVRISCLARDNEQDRDGKFKMFQGSPVSTETVQPYQVPCVTPETHHWSSLMEGTTGPCPDVCGVTTYFNTYLSNYLVFWRFSLLSRRPRSNEKRGSQHNRNLAISITAIVSDHHSIVSTSRQQVTIDYNHVKPG